MLLLSYGGRQAAPWKGRSLCINAEKPSQALVAHKAFKVFHSTPKQGWTKQTTSTPTDDMNELHHWTRLRCNMAHPHVCYEMPHNEMPQQE